MPAPFNLRQMTGAALVLLVALLFNASTRAQVGAQKETPAIVSGRVTDGDKGLAGVAVILMPTDAAARARSWARGRTDAEGRYQITNVAPGRYQAMLSAPIYVVEGQNNSQVGMPFGTQLNVSAGESIDNIDFRVVRGGVVTGRVTDTAGSPVIAEPVSITPVDNNPAFRRPLNFDPRDQMTDDRGVYRIYGLPPGSYRVSVGTDSGGGAVTFGSRKIYRRTFYPDATDQTQATPVEVTAGSETNDIDIRLAGTEKTFKASGRFVYADTGQPAADIPFGYGVLDPKGQHVSNFGGGTTTDARGQFQTGGLTPGHYAVFVFPFVQQNSTEFYSDPVTFDVTDSDVSGLTVSLKRGTSLSGVVSIEGVSDRATVARMLGQVRVFGYYDAREQTIVPQGYVSPASVAPDGTFHIGGLRPGKIRVVASADGVKGLTLSRVEMGGVNVSTNGIDVTEGGQLGGVRVVMTYGSSSVRGQINFVNGTPPQGARAMVFIRPASGSTDTAFGGRATQVDARGHFLLDNLAPGMYEVQAQLLIMGAAQGPGQFFMSDRQHVSAGEGIESQVTLTVDLSAPVNRGGRP